MNTSYILYTYLQTTYYVTRINTFKCLLFSEFEDYPVFGRVKYFPGYSFVKEDDEDYCFDWKSPPCDLKKESLSFSHRAWKHTNALDIWGVPVSGYYTTYGGGGYIAELDVNWDFSNRTLNELNTHFWFDRHTRAVFLEFTLYSANMNMFTYVRIIFLKTTSSKNIRAYHRMLLIFSDTYVEPCQKNGTRDICSPCPPGTEMKDTAQSRVDNIQCLPKKECPPSNTIIKYSQISIILIKSRI